MERQIPTRFIGEIVGNLIQITPELSKARLRIFYRGLNRNQSYITDEFANKLLSSLPYTPVVGIYNELTKDFGGHAEDRNVANTYGVVPEDPNLAWEDHLDEDGIVRTYACCDIILFTGRYDAANKIIGKQQSMELNIKTIQGDWQIIDSYGTEAYVYTDGRFIGLSVLGESKEPCFEGSAFFELVNKFNDFMAANTSNGGKDMTLDATNSEVKSQDAGVDSTPDGFAETEGKKTEEKDETSEEDVADSARNQEETEEETEEEKDKKDEDEDDEGKPSDAEKKDPPESEEPEEGDGEKEKDDFDGDGNSDSFDSSEDGNDNDVSDTSDTSNTEALGLGDDQNNNSNKPLEATSFDKGGDKENEFSAENFEKLNSKILELESKISTYESEANKYRNLYTALKADYDILVTEKNKDLVKQKEAKLSEYSAYLSSSLKEDFETRLDSYSSVDELEKDLLFAAKPTLFANRDNFAPTSTYGDEEEDELAALIKKSMKY